MLTNVDCKRKTEKSPAVVRLTGTDIIKSFPRNLIDVHVKIQCSKSEIVFTRRTWPSADNILSKSLICCGLPLEIIKTEIPRGPVVTTPCEHLSQKQLFQFGPQFRALTNFTKPPIIFKKLSS